MMRVSDAQPSVRRNRCRALTLHGDDEAPTVGGEIVEQRPARDDEGPPLLRRELDVGAHLLRARSVERERRAPELVTHVDGAVGERETESLPGDQDPADSTRSEET